MSEAECEIGVVGAGTMGGNLALNMADHGFEVAVYDVTAGKANELARRHEGGKVVAAETIEQFTGLLRRPRAVLLLVPAGRPVDDAIDSLVPCLDKGDMIMDGGNSHFTNTERRSESLSGKSLLFMGMGVSGGESGARFGPSLMPGGQFDAYDRVSPILEKIAAQVKGEPCVAYMGTGSAGHYVKMVHNGIEYAIMQLISETYDLMKRGLGMSAGSLASVYNEWNNTELNSYLIEITGRIFRFKDPNDPRFALVDMVLDRASQKGTGKWTSWEAMDRGIPTPNIDSALMMRNLSDRLAERKKVSQSLLGPDQRFRSNGDWLVGHLAKACYAGMIMSYAQGMALLTEGSNARGYGLNLEVVAKVWRGGCIIRAAVLENIRAAYRRDPGLPNLLLDEELGMEVARRQNSLRAVVSAASEMGLPVPGFSAALAYFDAYRSALLPANLIQAQRDYFGSHMYQRRDMPGKIFHTDWSAA